MRTLGTAFLDIIIGDGCAACDMPGPPACAACLGGIPPAACPACARCNHPWPRARDACPQCVPGVAWARHAAPYQAPLPALVSALKDGRRRALAEPLATVMAQRIAPPPAGAVLVPVPLGRRRMRERGFNQSALLAACLAGRWGLPVAHALGRDDAAPPQRGSGARERRRQVDGAFTAVGVPPLHAVLVDDVLTTGATLRAAARALRGAGCARVGAVSLARVVPPP